MSHARTALSLSLLPFALVATPAHADSEVVGEVSARAVGAKRDVLQNDEFDSSGLGLDGKLRAEKDLGIFRFWGEGRIGLFKFLDEERENRNMLQGEIGIARAFGDDFEIAVRGVYSENIVFVEALSADQQRVRAQMKWEANNNRIQLYGEYRERQYDQAIPADGTGTRFGGYYNRRLGSYHWVRFSAFTDNIDSNDDERDYNRVSGAAEYSHPFTDKIRARAALTLRRWTFPGRIALGDPSGDNRSDNTITPQIGADYGRSRGLFAQARVGYELRTSNDERFDGNTPRLSLEVGYRF